MIISGFSVAEAARLLRPIALYALKGQFLGGASWHVWAASLSRKAIPNGSADEISFPPFCETSWLMTFLVCFWLFHLKGYHRRDSIHPRTKAILLWKGFSFMIRNTNLGLQCICWRRESMWSWWSTAEPCFWLVDVSCAAGSLSRLSNDNFLEFKPFQLRSGNLFLLTER